MAIDYPNIRADRVCPLCPQPKPEGQVVCWPCYHLQDMRYGTAPHIRQHLDQREEFLARQAVIDRQLTRFFGL
jgi:hypothetical protein